MIERKTIVVLGGGMMGSTIARDLHGDFNVKVYDASEKAVAHVSSFGIFAAQKDLSDKAVIRDVVADADVVVGALRGSSATR